MLVYKVVAASKNETDYITAHLSGSYVQFCKMLRTILFGEKFRYVRPKGNFAIGALTMFRLAELLFHFCAKNIILCENIRKSVDLSDFMTNCGKLSCIYAAKRYNRYIFFEIDCKKSCIWGYICQYCSIISIYWAIPPIRYP